jgi:dTDP-4-amino-4,6-dideoxygalactose transaminase
VAYEQDHHPVAMNPHQVTRDFEGMLCAYTGAPYAVAVNSCTMALTLAVAWHFWKDVPPTHAPILGTRRITIPKRTYVSVPQAIIHAGGRPVFDDVDWLGMYQLFPLSVVDSARFFTGGMYISTMFMCVSFHASKTLGLEQGGAILHDSREADAWFRRARFDGRAEGVAPKDDTGIIVGWHCYMNPSTAAQGILKLHSLPRHNAPLPNDDYPDLSTLECFR